MTPLSSKTRSLRSDIVFAFALALACAVAWLVREVLMLLYVSALFATVLTPVVRSTGRLRIGRWRPFKGYAVLFLLLAMAGALTAFGFLALPPVIRDLQEFAREMPQRLPALLEKLRTFPSPIISTLKRSRQSFRISPAMRLPIFCFPSRIGRGRL